MQATWPSVKLMKVFKIIDFSIKIKFKNVLTKFIIYWTKNTKNIKSSLNLKLKTVIDLTLIITIFSFFHITLIYC